MSLLPTKLLTSWEDIGADHSDVPAELWCLQAVTPIFFKGLVHSADKSSCRHFNLFVVSLHRGVGPLGLLTIQVFRSPFMISYK